MRRPNLHGRQSRRRSWECCADLVFGAEAEDLLGRISVAKGSRGTSSQNARRKEKEFHRPSRPTGQIFLARARARASLMGADVSQGRKAMTGIANPRSWTDLSSSGMRST